MRVRKAFSLIEIIVVIILIGIIFSLVLNSYASKKTDPKLLGINDMPSYITNIAPKKSTILYMYGHNCKKSSLVVDGKLGEQMPLFGFNDESVIQKKDRFGLVDKVDFEDVKIGGKVEKICFALEFINGRFFEKFIVSSKDKHYLFNPLQQEVEVFDLFDKAEEVYLNQKFYPSSEYDYYDE